MNHQLWGREPTFGIHRTFVWGFDEGMEEGWLLKGKKNFFPALSGRVFAHDALEHCPSPHTNDRADECMALGAFIRIRGLSYQPFFAEGVSSDLRAILYDELHGPYDPMFPPPQQISVLLHSDGEAEHLLKQGMASAKKSVIEDKYDPLNAEQLKRVEAVSEVMMLWVRLGYRRTLRRFPGAHPYSLGALFERVATSADKVLGHAEEGRLVLRVDPITLEHKLTHYPSIPEGW